MRKDGSEIEDLSPEVQNLVGVRQPTLDGVVSPEVAEMFAIEGARHASHSSCGGVPCGYADQMPAEHVRSRMRQRVDDGEVFEL